mgnify:CR=1 FL=1
MFDGRSMLAGRNGLADGGWGASQVAEALPAKLDTGAHPELTDAVQVSHVPTLLVFRDGLPLLRHPGAVDEAGLESIVAQAAALDMSVVRAEIERELSPTETPQRILQRAEQALVDGNLDQARRLADVLDEQLERDGLARVAREVEYPLVPILGEMELVGELLPRHPEAAGNLGQIDDLERDVEEAPIDGTGPLRRWLEQRRETRLRRQ